MQPKFSFKVSNTVSHIKYMDKMETMAPAEVCLNGTLKFLSNIFYSIIHWRLCPSTEGRGPQPESSNFLAPLLSLFMLLLAIVSFLQDILVFHPILCPLISTILCFQCSVYCVWLSGVFSSFPFHVYHALSYVCHSASLHHDGVSDFVFHT